LLGERFRSLFRAAGELPANGGIVLAAGAARREAAARRFDAAEADRQSSGLRQFFEVLRGQPRMRILDLGGATQANINFITLQGHKLYTEDLLLSLDRLIEQARESRARQALPARVLAEHLNFPAGEFDGILVWDTLEFLEEDMLGPSVARLQAALKPGGTLLSFFHTHAKGETVPVYRYQIRDHQTLHLQPRALRPLPRAFNNRNLERMFANFRSVKFFLARDNLREVIVTR